MPQPLAAAYSPSAAPTLASRLHAGERSVTHAALALDPLFLGDEELARLDGGLENFFNLNTPADLEEAESLLRVREETGGGA